MTIWEVDLSLVSRASAGEGAAVAELYRRHAGAAFEAARAVTGSPHDAEDATSDAFVGLLQRLAARRLPASVRFRPYVLATARHAAIDMIRESARCRPTGQPDELDRPSDREQPGDRLLARVDAERVERVFQELPPRWQAVLLLVEVDGLAVKEAAERLGLSANATAQLAVRARAGLRRAFLRTDTAAERRP